MKQDWEIKKLGEVAKIIYGYTEKASFEKIGPKFLRITDIQDNGVEWDKVPYCNISESEFEKYKLSDGDIVFARTGATTGKSYLVSNPPKSVFASYLIKVNINNDELLPEFLYFFFQTNFYWDSINKGISGSAQGGFNATKLSELQIPLPPLSEQRRIVAILDEAFAAIAKAKANAELNLKNASELFEALCHKELRLKCKDYPCKILSQIVDLNRGGIKIGPFGSALKKHELVDNGDVRVLYIENIVNNKFDWEKEKYITSDKFNELRGYEVFPGDVLITIMGTIGRTAIVPEDLGRSIISSHLIKITPNQKLITSEFLNYSLNLNPFVVEQLFGQAKGAIMKGINSTIIKNLQILLPPLKEQMILVNLLNAYRTENQKLEIIYQKKINDLEELKNSVLQKAFIGELKTTKTSSVI